MKTLTGPINCTLCGVQWWNSVVVEAVPDGDETQYVCTVCLKQLADQDLINVVTTKEKYKKIWA